MSAKSKVISTKSLAPVRGGGACGANNGPTGSARSYAKGSTPSKQNWNPQKAPASKFFVGGVSGGPAKGGC